ncbi:hypothetical protein DY000_02032382 [Brassica cretica]|uniref:Uncharacterized protein n=1 Tax=Brassica cretica TaxID=69181 RepID=A0ABQ7DG62_BRACR|nr:hypothetical protein DY000_02032382 [Brassica cretica]
MEFWRRKKERGKARKLFLKNGSMFLEQLIADCNGMSNPIRMFSSYQISKAINNFDPKYSLPDIPSPLRWWLALDRGYIKSHSASLDDPFNPSQFQKSHLPSRVISNTQLKMFGLQRKENQASKPQQDVFYPFKTVSEKEQLIFRDKKQFASNGFDFLQKQRNQRKRQNMFDEDEKRVINGDRPFTKVKKSNRDMLDQNELQTYASLEKILHKAIFDIQQLKNKENTNTSYAQKQQHNFSSLSNSDLKTNMLSFDKSKAVKPTSKAHSTRKGQMKNKTVVIKQTKKDLLQFKNQIKLKERGEPVELGGGSNDMSPGQMRMCLDLALRCCEERNEDRPKMILPLMKFHMFTLQVASFLVTEYMHVYSFGVLLIILLTGRSVYFTGSEAYPVGILEYVKGLYENKKLKEVIYSMMMRYSTSAQIFQTLEEKEREGAERMVLQQWSTLLQDLIADSNGISNPIRFFSAGQILKATDGFDPKCSLSLHRLFTWYKGVIEGRHYAIKKFTESELIYT